MQIVYLYFSPSRDFFEAYLMFPNVTPLKSKLNHDLKSNFNHALKIKNSIIKNKNKNLNIMHQ